ncbi:MAG: IPT/TIG domain-containing protein [Solirubrobacteraceae bacterium]
MRRGSSGAGGRFVARITGFALLVLCSSASAQPAAALAPSGQAPSQASAASAQQLTGPAAPARSSAARLSKTPSRTQPYAACPPPAKRHAACQSVVYPPATRLSSLALPAAGGIDGSGLTPAELQAAYKLPSAAAGSGQTIAIVDAYDDPTAESDLANYRSTYGIPPCTAASGCFRKVDQSGGSKYPSRPTAEQGDWDLEESLDLDMVSAICPDCHIVLVEANSSSYPNLTAAENEAATLGATEISNSWAGEEFAEERSYDTDFDHPGIPIAAASGDWGYDNRELQESAPNYPAASPNVIAVGGTVLAPAETARGWSEQAWERSGSGCSPYEPKPSFQKDSGCARRIANDVAAVAQDLSVYDTTHATGITGLPAWIAVGGTSASTPIVAAVEALSEASERSLGPAAFYRTPGSLFDVISGSNGFCTPSYPCTAGGGYDGPTGNGTPDGALSAESTPPSPELTVTGLGTGSGSVESSPAGIRCPGSCNSAFPRGSQVTLTASPAAGSTFEGWQGACTGAGPCSVSLQEGAAVTAVFRAGSPAGWGVLALAAPAGRIPLPAGSSPGSSFFALSLSADARLRAKTIFDEPPVSCTYATSETGGIWLERAEGAGWTPDGSITAPALGSGSAARWANCAAFGQVTKLSADGSTLLVTPEATQAGSAYRCAAFVYRNSGAGWTLDGTLFPTGVGPEGTSNSQACKYFGIEGAISDDGTRVAVMSNGRLDLFQRGTSGWSLEQEITLPNGPRCTETVGPRKLAMSGNGEELLVGQSNCEVQGNLESGLVYSYTRSTSGWALAQTIESPEGQFQNEFGDVVAMSDDGSTAVVATNSQSTGLPHDAGAAWVLERLSGHWQIRGRLTAPTPEAGSSFDCPAVASGGSRIVCGAWDTVGFNARQGSIYSFERPSGGWGSPGAPVRAFATFGAAGELLGRSTGLGWRQFAASADTGLIDAPIAAAAIADGIDPNELIGYEFTAPAVFSPPSLVSFAPSTAGPATQVVVHGTNLEDATTVAFGGVPAASYTVQSPEQLTATVPSHARTGPISLTTPGGGATSAESLTFVGPQPPSVSSISPSSGPTAGGTEVLIHGANFQPGSTVAIGGAATAVDVRSETEITAFTPAWAAGSDEVVVSAEGTSSTGGPTFTYLAPVPVVSTIAPEDGSTAGGTEVTITGSHFLPDSTVTIGGAATHVNIRSETEITALTPASPAGREEVVVSDEAGSSTGGPDFTYVVPAPTVSSIAPASGSTAGGTEVLIKGSDFLPGSTVTIGGAATAVDVRSETEITALTPAWAAGSDEVLVSDEAGHSSGGPSFTYVLPPPSVASITPAEGAAKRSSRVTIEGTGFLPGASVQIGGQATAVRVLSETEITAKTPREPVGGYEVVVADSRGTSSGGPIFDVLGPPVPEVLSVSPDEGPAAGGTPITIRGARFLPRAKVSIGPRGKAVSVLVVSETEITAVTHAEPAGTYDVVVTNQRGIPSGGSAYTFLGEPPLPASLPPAGCSVWSVDLGTTCPSS